MIRGRTFRSHKRKTPGIILSEPYTDHNPVEANINLAVKNWVRAGPLQRAYKQLVRPNVNLFRGGTSEALGRQANYARRVPAAIEKPERPLTWHDILAITQEAAFDVVEADPGIAHKPWLADKAKEL